MVIVRPVCAVKRLAEMAHTGKRHMNALIVYAHPERTSFNAALKSRLAGKADMGKVSNLVKSKLSG